MTKPKEKKKRKWHFESIYLIRWRMLKETFYSFLNTSRGEHIFNKSCDSKTFSYQKEMCFLASSGPSDNVCPFPRDILVHI